jgi:hypothetical protein
MFLSSFSNKLIKSEWNSLQLIIFKVKHTWTNFFARQESKKINFFQNQNDTCAQLFTLVMKFHDRQSSEQCIRKLISRHCLEKTRTRWNDFLFLITDDRDFRPQICTNGLVFRECKHIKNIFEDVYFTKNSFHITLTELSTHTHIVTINTTKISLVDIKIQDNVFIFFFSNLFLVK